MAKYRILSIDGGGIRGLIPLILLERLGAAARMPGWLDQVDLVAGTSTGGLIALALAAGKPLREIRDVYADRGGEIFGRSFWRILTHLSSLLGAKYDIANLERVIVPFLGRTTRLGDLAKNVLIAAFDLDSGPDLPQGRRWKPKLFHNFDNGESDSDALAWKVGLSTSAAPTYFAPHDGFVDGGVYAANPSMCALAQTQDARWQKRPELGDVVLLSLGTGTALQYLPQRHPDWGDVQWIEPLLAIMLDGVSGIAHFQCHQLLRERYCRLAPDFPAGTSIAMDAVDRVGEMAAFAESVDLSEAAAWLRSHWA